MFLLTVHRIEFNKKKIRGKGHEADHTFESPPQPVLPKHALGQPPAGRVHLQYLLWVLLMSTGSFLCLSDMLCSLLGRWLLQKKFTKQERVSMQTLAFKQEAYFETIV